MKANPVLYDEKFLDDVAADIWRSARLLASEGKSGMALNSKWHIDKIRRELQTAATVIATTLLERQEEVKKLHENIGAANAQVKLLKKQLEDANSKLAQVPTEPLIKVAKSKTGGKSSSTTKAKSTKALVPVRVKSTKDKPKLTVVTKEEPAISQSEPAVPNPVLSEDEYKALYAKLAAANKIVVPQSAIPVPAAIAEKEENAS